MTLAELKPSRTNLMKVSLTSLPASGPLELHSYISESPAGSQSGPRRERLAELLK